MKYDKRSKRAIAIDKSKQATMTYPRTPEGIASWQKHKGHADLRGYDTSRQHRLSERWGRSKNVRSMAEYSDIDTYDWKAETDSTLGKIENRNQIRKNMRNFML